MALLPFPLDLANTVENSAYPAICFTHHAAKNNRPGDRIFLPMPPGIEIADAMAYSTINLGIIGDVMTKTIEGAMNEAGAAKQVKGAAINLVDSAIDKIKSANLASAASIYTRHRLKSEQYADVINFASKQIISPNTNTTFQGSSLRSYNFKFKMVARSATESNRIKTIVDKFRLYMYPMGNDLIQEYPGSWQISFVFGSNNNKNKFIPEPYRCYLTNFTSAYNAGNNMWHEDGAPVEVDIAMNFQEIKALTRHHIDSLNNQTQPDNSSINPAPVSVEPLP